jgi:hypothetical protein
MKVMRRIFDVLRRDRQLAAANIVRSCPDDWKQEDGLHSIGFVDFAAVVHDDSRTCTGESQSSIAAYST